MSRSNPQDAAVNPSVRWFEWNGEQGTVRYYDKDAKKNVDVGKDFTFLLLDQLGSVRGWHDASASGIYSNEVRDTRQDVLVVKAFKGGTIAEGLYKVIKDRVNAAGGKFVSNCYIGFKHDGKLAIGSIRFKGSALQAWMEFCRAHRSELYSHAIQISGYTEGKKGRITFRAPVLKIKELSPESNSEAVALDKVLQQYLDAYLKRNTREQVHAVDDPMPDYDEPQDIAPNDDDIPF